MSPIGQAPFCWAWREQLHCQSVLCRRCHQLVQPVDIQKCRVENWPENEIIINYQQSSYTKNLSLLNKQAYWEIAYHRKKKDRQKKKKKTHTHKKTRVFWLLWFVLSMMTGKPTVRLWFEQFTISDLPTLYFLGPTHRFTTTWKKTNTFFVFYSAA